MTPEQLDAIKQRALIGNLTNVRADVLALVAEVRKLQTMVDETEALCEDCDRDLFADFNLDQEYGPLSTWWRCGVCCNKIVRQHIGWYDPIHHDFKTGPQRPHPQYVPAYEARVTEEQP